LILVLGILDFNSAFHDIDFDWSFTIRRLLIW